MTRPRTLALLDVENLILRGPADACVNDYTFAIATAAVIADLTTDCQVVVGLGSHNTVGIFATHMTWPQAAVRCLSGPDGADHALLRYAADIEAIKRSFTTVVIGSGDGIFSPLADRLNRAGLHTITVSWARHLSKRLQLTSAETRLLDPQREPTHPAIALAA